MWYPLKQRTFPSAATRGDLPINCRRSRVKILFIQCWERFAGIGEETIPVAMTLEKYAGGSGLGSSACSSSLRWSPMNEHCGKPLNDTRLLALMGETGRPYLRRASLHDNVAPLAFLAGMRLMIEETGIISQQVPGFDEWLWVLAYPEREVSTAEKHRLFACAVSPSGLHCAWTASGRFYSRLLLAAAAACRRAERERCYCRTIPRARFTAGL